MTRETTEILRQIYTEAAEEARAEAKRLRASTEEFSRDGEDLKAAEIERQDRIAAEYDSLLRELPA